jgi:hypothetical protein
MWLGVGRPHRRPRLVVGHLLPRLAVGRLRRLRLGLSRPRRLRQSPRLNT